MTHIDSGIIHISASRLKLLRQESYEEGLSEKIETVKDIIIEALMTDGEHHKQWYLEKLLTKLGFDIIKIKEELEKEEHKWEEGIPP